MAVWALPLALRLMADDSLFFVLVPASMPPPLVPPAAVPAAEVSSSLALVKLSADADFDGRRLPE